MKRLGKLLGRGKERRNLFVGVNFGNRLLVLGPTLGQLLHIQLQPDQKSAHVGMAVVNGPVGVSLVA